MNILRVLKRLVIFVFTIVIIFGGLLFIIEKYLNTPVEHPDVELSLEMGTSVNTIVNALGAKGVIKCPVCFKWYVRAMGYAPRLRAGDYIFESGGTAADVLRKLLDGDFRTYKLTVPEGLNIKETASLLAKAPFIKEGSGESFAALAKDPSVIAKSDIGWPLTLLEGYLYPSTYDFYKLEDVTPVISRMTGTFRDLYSERIKAGAPKLGLTPQEVVILASIVEKETAVPAERPLVASVFLNRLKKGMLLQSDPTIIYGLKNYDGNIRKSDITDPHLYNTYVHSGLPPGPICNPGGSSIDAVLNPAATDYLFFVSKNDGSHIFSKSLDEHNRAVNEYQRKK